jgi:cytochrome o ubiquinol oxidase subunit 2
VVDVTNAAEPHPVKAATPARRRRASWLAVLPLLLLSACGTEYRLFHPVGPVASAELHYTVLNTAVMLLIIVPTTIATLVFALRYRKSRNAAYDPSFSHSLALELAMWGVPLFIVVILTFCTYSSVFAVNPADPQALGGSKTGAAATATPGSLQVDVITTDWQWIFVYPQQKIATIDDLVVPQGETVKLELTSATVTNDFYIPQVAPMIDVMPGMRTLDAFQVNRPGNYEGFSADFSGAGFSWMQFATRIMAPADFAAWVKQTQAAPNHLDFARFLKLAQPTINQKAEPSYFSDADPNLFREVYNAIQDGQVFPVPEDIDTKAPYPSPVAGKQNEVNAKS